MGLISAHGRGREGENPETASSGSDLTSCSLSFSQASKGQPLPGDADSLALPHYFGNGLPLALAGFPKDFIIRDLPGPTVGRERWGIAKKMGGSV